MIINTTSWKLGVVDDSDVARGLQFRFAARSILVSRNTSLPRHTIIALGASGGKDKCEPGASYFPGDSIGGSRRGSSDWRLELEGVHRITASPEISAGGYGPHELAVEHPSGNPRSLWNPSQLEREIEFRGRNATAGLEGTSQSLTSTSTRETNLDQSQDISETRLHRFHSEFQEFELPEIQQDTEAVLENGPDEPSPHELELEEDGIYCDVAGCVRKFSSQQELNHHMRYHTRPEKCPHCELDFGTVTHLNRHINDVHNTTTKYFCEVSGCKYSKGSVQKKSFARKDNWERHMRSQHKEASGS